MLTYIFKLKDWPTQNNITRFLEFSRLQHFLINNNNFRHYNFPF